VRERMRERFLTTTTTTTTEMEGKKEEKETTISPSRRPEGALRRESLGLERLRKQPSQRRGALPAQRGRPPEPDVEAGLELDREDRRADLPPRPVGQGPRPRGAGDRGGRGAVKLDDGARRGRGEGRDGGLGDVGRGEEQGLFFFLKKWCGVEGVFEFFSAPRAPIECEKQLRGGRNAKCSLLLRDARAEVSSTRALALALTIGWCNGAR